MRFRKYIITEADKKWLKYKKGDLVKVSAERNPIYSHDTKNTAYVPSYKETIKTLEIVDSLGGGQKGYTVKIKGSHQKWAGGVKTSTYAKLSIIDDFTGLLYNQKAKWYVSPI